MCIQKNITASPLLMSNNTVFIHTGFLARKVLSGNVSFKVKSKSNSELISLLDLL